MTLEEVKKEYIVYMHKNKINGKVYIGITYQNVKYRWRKNGEGYKKQKFYNAIKKYGWNNFEHIILFENLTFEEACLKEQELIKKHNSNNRKYGYNHSIGGDKSSKGSHWVMSEETKEKDRQAHLGKKNGMYGVKGKRHPSYGKKMSDEQKQLLIESRKGLIPWNKGKQLSKEHKNKVSIATKKAMQRPEVKEKLHKPKTIINKSKWKKVICIETNEIFESITLASKNKNCKSGDISRVCKGKSKICGGYHWKYYEE